MHDAACVSRIKRTGDLSSDGDHLIDRKSRRRVDHPIGERRALDELHDQCGTTARFLEAVNVSDVWMVERREHLRFTLETGEAIVIVGKRLRQDLDRHVAIQLGIVRAIDLTHAAGAQGGEHLINPEASAWHEGHDVLGLYVAHIQRDRVVA
jgi:hypothetical protein